MVLKRLTSHINTKIVARKKGKDPLTSSHNKRALPSRHKRCLHLEKRNAAQIPSNEAIDEHAQDKSLGNGCWLYIEKGDESFAVFPFSKRQCLVTLAEANQCPESVSGYNCIRTSYYLAEVEVTK